MNYILKQKIKEVNKDIAKDVAILTGCVVAVGIGAFGTISFTKELIDFYNSGEKLTLATRFSADWYEAKVGFSIIPITIGGFVSSSKIPKLKENIQLKKNLKKKLQAQETNKK